jgi:hypothetical protein
LSRDRLLPDPVIEAYKKRVDRDLIRENPKRSIEKQILNLMELQRFAEGWRRGDRKGRERL